MIRHIILILLTLLISACSLIYEKVEEAPEENSEEIMLSFTVTSPIAGLQSRTDAAGHDEVESDYQAFENGVDPDDIVILIFAKVASTEGEGTLVGEFTPLTKKNQSYTSDDMEMMGALGSYTVNVRLKKDDFDSKLGLSGTGTERIVFRILMLTSCTRQGTGGSLSTYKWNLNNLTDYEAIIEKFADNTNYSYPMDYIYNRSLAEETISPAVGDIYPNKGVIIGSNGNVSGNGRLYMPMFGTNTFTVTRKELEESGPAKRVFLGSLDLLRSIAKMRVVDNITGKDEDGYPKIIGASTIGDQVSIAILPKDALNYKNGTQVHQPNPAVPGSNETTTFKLGYVPEGWTVNPPVESKGLVFIGYCPEQTIHPLTSATRYPIIRITVATSRDAAGNDETTDFDVPMAGYNGQSFSDTFGSYILRNHIYTLSITGITSSAVNFNVAVNDWKKIEYEYEY